LQGILKRFEGLTGSSQRRCQCGVSAEDLEGQVIRQAGHPLRGDGCEVIRRLAWRESDPPGVSSRRTGEQREAVFVNLYTPVNHEHPERCAHQALDWGHESPQRDFEAPKGYHAAAKFDLNIAVAY
jgi:hypothetical protein